MLFWQMRFIIAVIRLNGNSDNRSSTVPLLIMNIVDVLTTTTNTTTTTTTTTITTTTTTTTNSNNNILFLCRVNSHKANYRHSTV
jgi:hypothetical protein